jgi:ribosomal protein S18 acetylase RimI-like enzyme
MFNNEHISYAGPSDIPAIVKLLNSAYRGDSSRKGWTTEADLLQGEIRTDEQEVEKLMNQPGSVFLKYSDTTNLSGCVNLQQHGDKIYLGMLSVSPHIQARGIGRQLMAAAESHAKKQTCSAIYMTVISVRKELIAWYERLGYKATGETKPFLVDQKYGIPTQELMFLVLQKELT